MVTASEAAIKAHADTQTIHAWCRTGRVKAVKRGAAWDIDPESLAVHLDYTDAVATAFLSAGGREWRKFDRHRVYFDDNTWQDWSGLVFTTHDGGRPNSATLDGRPIVDSNGGTGMLTWAIKGRIYFETADHTLVLPGNPDLIMCMPAFWGDGDRAEFTIDLGARISAGAAARTGLDFGTPVPVRIGPGRYDLALAIPVTASPLETS